MNKKVYNTVLLFTGSVLIGIILLQILWLNNLTKIRKQELQSNTQQALTATVAKIEKNENLSLIMDNFHPMIPDSLVTNMMVPLSELEQLAELENLEHIESDSGSWKMVALDSLHDMADSEKMIRITNDQRSNIERKIVINSTFTTKLSNKLKDVDSLVQQLVFEINSAPLRDRIDPDTLNQMLTRELESRGINVAFEYAIFNKDSMMFKSKNFIESSALMRFETKLFPDDIFEKDLKLVLYYPASSSTGFVFSKMKTFLILTGIFTLGILIAFYLTIRTIKKQKKLGDMKNDFINNITHEFKTPIATSSIAIAALANDQVRTDSEKFNYYTEILKEENSKMNLQVEKVLQMAMMEKGKIEMSLQEVDVHDSLNEAIKGFELLFKENGIAVTTDLNAERAMVKADPFHLKHVFNNIIDNAIKYKRETPKLSIETKTQANQMIISFIDNGQGMSVEVQKNAFEKFYRGQKGDIHEVKGFGLGLSYAKNIVESCNGTIKLISSPDKGTEVIISLPLV